MKTVRVMERALRLTVDEVHQVLLALRNAKVLRSLSGRQRQHLEDAIANLTEARTQAAYGWAEIPPEVAVEVLRCVAFTQRWLGDMFDHFGSVDDRT
jgi:hypothetical protein